MVGVYCHCRNICILRNPTERPKGASNPPVWDWRCRISLEEILTKMLDKLELSGPDAGELLDPQLSLYEVKIKHPPIRLYFKHNKATNEIYVFEFEMKTSPEKQKATIIKLKKKLG